MKKIRLIVGTLLVVVGLFSLPFMVSQPQPVSPDGVTYEDSLTGMAVYLTQTVPAYQLGTLNQVPATSTPPASLVSAQIIEPGAVQSLPDAEILGYVYLDVNGGVTSSSGLNVPAEWDGTKPPQPMYVGNKLDGASQLFCELDVDLTTNEQTVYRCGYPGKG